MRIPSSKESGALGAVPAARFWAAGPSLPRRTGSAWGWQRAYRAGTILNAMSSVKAGRVTETLEPCRVATAELVIVVPVAVS